MQQLVIDVVSPDVYANGDPAENGLPHAMYDYLREHAPCYRQPIDDPQMEDEVWVLSRHADIQSALRDPETFCSRRGVTTRVPDFLLPEQGGKPAMIVMDGEDHRRNRRVVSRGFTPPVVRTFERQFRAIARAFVADAVAKGEFDFVPDIAVSMPLNAICDLIGVPAADRQKFLQWANAFTMPADTAFAPSPEDSLAAVASMCAYGVELAEHRRECPADDMMSKIVAAVDEETLSDDEFMGLMLLLSAAGSDTTRNALSHGLHALLRHPDQMAWLRAQADDIPRSATTEILRWSSPIIHTCRVTTRDVELHGELVREGEKVAMLYPSANFDPEAFEDPRRFDLTREDNPHVAFATGSHICLGRHIAQLELKIVFEELLRQTTDIRPAGEIRYIRDSAIRGIHTLPVSVTAA